MALYTIIAGGAEMRQRACWILEAASLDGALAKAAEIRSAGSMPWLPTRAVLAARRSSTVERAFFAEALKGRPVGGPSMDPGDQARRSERQLASIFKKLWDALA